MPMDERMLCARGGQEKIIWWVHLRGFDTGPKVSGLQKSHVGSQVAQVVLSEKYTLSLRGFDAGSKVSDLQNANVGCLHIHNVLIRFCTR